MSNEIDESTIDVVQGSSPLILAFPHMGIDIPPACAAGFTDAGKSRMDIDQYIDQLYTGLVKDVTFLRTVIHRHVIDMNRPPNDESLYPGQNTTSLCPLTDFDGKPLYHPGHEPDSAEIARRLAAYHVPYHKAITEQVARVKALHGFAIVYDCHSIRSEIPFLFEGVLPDFNIGTNSGASCAPEIEKLVHDICKKAEGYTCVLNGRFKGGWTTRHHGQPSNGVHAIQMELAKSTYMMETPPWRYQSQLGNNLRIHLTNILSSLQEWKP